jgi:HK97 family phage prohead protease
MTDELLTREVDDAVLVRGDPDADGRTVELRLLAWGEVATTPQGRESFARGAFAGADASSVLIESERHDGAIVGVGQSIEERDDGAYLVGRVSDTTAGRDLLTLLADRVIRSASIVFRPIQSSRRPDGVIVRDRVELRRVALLPRGAYRSAGVLAVRGEVMDPMNDPVEVAPAPAVDLSPVLARLGAQDEAIARLSVQLAGGAGGTAAIHELSRFDSLGEAYMASTSDPEVRTLLTRALADQTTPDNPGIVPPGWLSDIKGIMPRKRPGIDAFGGAAALPPSGMELDWPALVPLVGDRIGVQAAEKVPVVTGKVSFGKGSKPIATYAGASDVSYQLLRRSSPAYRDAYARVMLGEYARVTDNVFVDELALMGTGVASWDAAADTTGAAFVALLFATSVEVEDATGSPADAVVAATDVFLAIAGKEKIVPSSTSTATALGNATASTLQLGVSGLRIVHDPNLAPTKFLIGNSEAARWHEDGPFPVEAEDVEKLGRNIGYWGLGATALFAPAGVVVGTMTGGVTTASRRRRAADES